MKKKLLAVVSIVLMLIMLVSCAFAMGDDISDIEFSGKTWSEQKCKPSMLNFGYVRVPLGSTLQTMKNTNECTNVKGSIKIKQINALMDDGRTFYIYAKFGGKGINYLYIDANLIVTVPDGTYYRTDGEWTIKDCDNGKLYHFSWFFDLTDIFTRIRADHDGTFPKGTYDFSLFFNGDTFRVKSVKFK